MADENIIIEQPIIEYDTVDVVETDDMANAISETIEIIEIENVEVFTVDTDEAFPALGQQNEQLNHSHLNNRDLPNQHPITAITGLRAELDSIEALQTVYSDVKQLADYYEWEDGNRFIENKVGYFVSLCSDARTIKICEGEDIFGVTVSSAGFIGGQDKISRNHQYALVSYSGIVNVRCESNVRVGDYITSNRDGVAKKSNGRYGCKVIALNNTTGIPYATIALNISIDQMDKINDEIIGFNNRLNNAETNIITAINVANEAYNKAGQLGEIGQDIIDKVDKVSDVVDSVSEKSDQIESIIASAIASTEEAKTLASSAIVTAETAKNEAVNRANEVLEMMTDEAENITKNITDIRSDVDKTMFDLQQTTEDFIDARDELKDNINKINGNIAEFKQEVTDTYATTESVVTFQTDATKAISDVTQIAGENKAAIDLVSGYTYTDAEGNKIIGLAGIGAQVDKNKSDVQLIASQESENSNAIAGIQAQADANKSQLDVLASFEYGNDKDVYPYINSPAPDAEGNISGDVLINGITFTDNGDGTITANGTAVGNADFYIIQNNISFDEGKYSLFGCSEGGSITSYYIQFVKTSVDNTMVTYEQTNEEYRFDVLSGDTISAWIRIVDGVTVTNVTFTPSFKHFFQGIAGLKNQVAKNGSSIDLLTSFASDSGSGTAGLIAKVSDHDAKLTNIATWKSQVANEDGTLKVVDSIAAIQQKADANEANIGLVASWQENLEIGGRNLILKSNEINFEASDTGNGKHTTLIDGVITIHPINDGNIYTQKIKTSIDRKKEETYTLSFEIKSMNIKSDTKIGLYWYPSEKYIKQSYIAKSENWTKYTLTYTQTGEDVESDVSFIFGFFNLIADETYCVRYIKLEKGNVATDWSTAPEDDINSIATINVKAEEFASQIEQITTWKGETQENMTKIEQTAGQNGASINMIVASIDKYSVGEYSQSYGLTQEQARNILKIGMVYIPTKHNNNPIHEEKYLDNEEIHRFTQGYYYTWDGNDWIGSASPLVIFSNQVPTSGEYWYIDSDAAPEGYEPNALYIYKDDKWVKVNIFYNNSKNRAVSSISQEVDSISLEVADARGNIASHQQWLDDNSANIQDVVSWKSSVKDDVSNIATIKETADEAGASIAQVVQSIGDKGEVNAASIVAAINNTTGDSIVKIDANHVVVDGSQISLKGKTININANDVLGIESPYFSVDTAGNMKATSGQIGGWNIESVFIDSYANTRDSGARFYLASNASSVDNYLWARDSNNDVKFSVSKAGILTAKGVDISGKITATTGDIGGWDISSNGLNKYVTYDGITYRASVQTGSAQTGTAAFLVQKGGENQFYVTYAGYLYARNANITGTITASSGNFSNDVTIGGTAITAGHLRKLYRAAREGYNDADSLQIKRIDANTGVICDWTISSTYLTSPLKQHPWAPSGYYGQVRLSANKVEYGVTTGSSIASNKWSGTYWSYIVDVSNNNASDRRLKKDINCYTENYEQLFDLLNPVRYKYIDGTSDRYHTGFIAQEVVSAIEQAGLTTQDFAAVMLRNEGHEDEQWQLRRDEFVSLNTWQIQKAKARISDLEARVAELEAMIKGE